MASQFAHEHLVMNELDLREFYSLSVVDTLTGCWNWNGLVINGYPVFYMPQTRTNVPAYRVAYHTFVGDVPEPLQLAHVYNEVLDSHCKCAFWGHVRPLTRSQNQREGHGGTIERCAYGHDRRWGQTLSGVCRVCARIANCKWAGRENYCKGCGYASCRCILLTGESHG